MTYIRDANCLIDATVNGKQFSFSRSDIDIATWFLMLALEMTIEEAGLDNASKVMLLSTLIWFLMFLDWRWNEKWFEKKSMRWLPGSNFLSKGEKEGWISFKQLSMSTNGEVRQNLYFWVRWLSDRIYDRCPGDLSELRMDFIKWFEGKVEPLKRNLLYIFLIWRYIGIRLEIASIPAIGDIWKALDIQRAALHCIFLRILRKSFKGTLL